MSDGLRMKLLALEFSSEQRSVAVREPGSGGVPVGHSEVVETGGRATRAFGLIEEALKQAGVEREQVGCLAVGLGPGSYTGIRAAIAVVQGWQLAREVKLLGISSAEALAAQAQAEGISGRINVIIDAHRDEFYLAKYDLDASGYQAAQALGLVTLAELQANPPEGLLLGPAATRWFPSARNLFPSASSVARLALGRTDFVPGEKLEPIYLRETTFVKAPPPRVLPT